MDEDYTLVRIPVTQTVIDMTPTVTKKLAYPLQGGHGKMQNSHCRIFVAVRVIDHKPPCRESQSFHVAVKVMSIAV